MLIMVAWMHKGAIEDVWVVLLGVGVVIVILLEAEWSYDSGQCRVVCETIMVLSSS